MPVKLLLLLEMFTGTSGCANERVSNMFSRDVTYCFVIKTSVTIFFLQVSHKLFTSHASACPVPKLIKHLCTLISSMPLF